MSTTIFAFSISRQAIIMPFKDFSIDENIYTTDDPTKAFDKVRKQIAWFCTLETEIFKEESLVYKSKKHSEDIYGGTTRIWYRPRYVRADKVFDAKTGEDITATFDPPIMFPSRTWM